MLARAFTLGIERSTQRFSIGIFAFSLSTSMFSLKPSFFLFIIHDIRLA